jgi:YD repeat-containing protein
MPNVQRSETMKTIRSHTRLLLLSCVLAAAAASMAASSHAANGSVAYTFDALGRVTTASYDTGVCILYSYDPNGNRLSETINVSAASGSTGVWGCFNWNASGGALWG